MHDADAAEVAGFTKLARLSPDDLRALFARHGTLHGGLRGALIGGALGSFLGDSDDPAGFASHVLGSALLGGGTGALAGRIQGLRSYTNPFKTTSTPDGMKMLHLRSPGEFGNELIHATFSANHPDVKYRSTLPATHWAHRNHPTPTTYVPEKASDLLATLAEQGHLPPEVFGKKR